MNFSAILSQIPLIYDIPIRDLWKPPIAALVAYLVPKLLEKIFPIEPDNGPFANLRYQIAYRHYGVLRIENPRAYHFIHADVKDNIHLVVFLIALYILKPENQEFRNQKLLLFSAAITMCIFADSMRQMAHMGLSTMAHYIPRNHRWQIFMSQATEKIARLVAPTNTDFM